MDNERQLLLEQLIKLENIVRKNPCGIFIEACYDLAVAQLKDKDKANWVRWYFSVNSK